jgi:hypothetical protein
VDSSGGVSEFGRILETFKGSTAGFESKKNLLVSKNSEILDIIQNFHYRINSSWAEELSKTGGQRGTVYDRILDGDLPLLKGCIYWDEQSMNEVPYLSIEVDSETSKFAGLGCTVLDPILGQVIPAVIGGRMLGPNSGEVVPINGVCKTADFDVVVPFSNIDFKKQTVNSNVPALLEELLLTISMSATQRNEIQAHVSEPNQIAILTPQQKLSDSDAHPAITMSHANLLVTEDASVGVPDLALQDTDRREENYDRPDVHIGGEQIQVIDSQSQVETVDEILGMNVKASAVELAGGLHTPVSVGRAVNEQDGPENIQVIPGKKNIQDAVAAASDQHTVVAAPDPSLEQSGLHSKTEVKRSFQEILHALVQEFRVCDDNPDISQIITHAMDSVRQKQEDLKQNLEQQRDNFHRKHQDMVKKVQESSLGDEEGRKKLMADMEQQKHFMDEIVEQEHARQMSMFERAQVEAAERRLRKMQKLLQQQEAEAAACFGNLSTAQRAAQRLEIEMDNALEDSISNELSNAAARRVASISAVQQDVLEALAGTAGAPNSDELMEQLLGRYEADIDEIETRTRQSLSESISRISAQMEIDFARKLARLRVTTEKARSKKNWGQLRLMVKVGALTIKKTKRPEEIQQLAAARQDHQRVRLVAALEAQENTEINDLTESLGNLHRLEIAEAEEIFAQKLIKMDDEEARQLLMKEHEYGMEEMKKRLDLDKQRQLEALNDKLQNRRHKLVHEQEVLHKEEVSLLASPKNAKEAERFVHKLEAMVKHEQERALLVQALEQGTKLEKEEIRREIEDMAAAEVAECAARLAESLSATDDEDVRADLIRKHESELEALRRRMGLEKERQQHEMQERLAQRRKKQIALHDQMQVEAVRLLASPDTVAQADSLALAMEAIARQEQHRVQMLSSLQELAGAEREEAIQETNLLISKATAEKELELLAKLEAVDDISERTRLLKIHESEMAALQQRMLLEKQRQLSELDQRCRERKMRKIDQTLGQMQEEQLKLISSPESSKEAELVGLKLDVLLKQEMGAAQLNTAIVEQSSMELRVLQENLAAKGDAAVASANANLAGKLQGKNDEERHRLLAQHEIDLARIRAEGSISVAKAEEEMFRLIQERKEKKRNRLEQQYMREAELLAAANDKESAVKAMEHVVLETSMEIEHEKKAAKLLFNIVCESQSEVKLLRQEMSEKSAQIIQNEEGRLEYELSKLDSASSERQILLQVCCILSCGR